MKTLKDVKEALALGTKWHCVHHGYAPDWTQRELGTREVVEKRSNAVGFRTEFGVTSWLYYPTRKNIVIHSDTCFSVIDHEFGLKPLLTYKLIK